MDSQLLLLNKTNALIKPPLFSFFASSKPRYNPSSNFSLGCKLKRVMCAMKSYRLSELNNSEVESLKARPRIDFSSIFGIVNPIVDDVRQRGDAAVKDYTSRFDKVKLDKIVENVSELPDPVVNSKNISFSKRNSLHFLFYLFSDLYGLLFLVQMLLQTFHLLAFAA